MAYAWVLRLQGTLWRLIIRKSRKTGDLAKGRELGAHGERAVPGEDIGCIAGVVVINIIYQQPNARFRAAQCPFPPA